MLHITSRPLRSLTAGTLLCLCAGLARAHDGHSQHASHWHATDLWGFVAIGALLAVAAWRGRK
jgi:hypothetical protein